LSLPDAHQPSAHSFASVLKQTLSSESSTQTWCESCKTFQSCEQTKDVVDLPNVLMLTTPQTEPHAQAFWTAVSDDYSPSSVNENLSQWIPFVVKPQRDSKTNKWSVQEFSDTTLQSDPNNIYDLVGIVAAISDTSEPRGHAVSLVRVSTWCHQKAGDEGGIGNSWYLFNDFHILPISKYEAVHVDADWKVPCVLVYARRQIDERVPIPAYVNPITEDVMFNDKSKNNATPQTFTPLTKESLPKPGDELAIDAEFVRIREEEVVEKPDGSRFVIRPGDFSLARVSVLRCQPDLKPEDDGKCVIDDYIATRDSTILDYLTQYSGIVPGDLDPSSSTHHVTSLKSAYLKLRWLVDRGCKFIGHGLRKDFRIISALQQLLATSTSHLTPWFT
jgi:PAB-dependent poly(A)-specific ribonuclease subunit 2